MVVPIKVDRASAAMASSSLRSDRMHLIVSARVGGVEGALLACSSRVRGEGGGGVAVDTLRMLFCWEAAAVAARARFRSRLWRECSRLRSRRI